LTWLFVLVPGRKSPSAASLAPPIVTFPLGDDLKRNTKSA